ncbi:MAG: RibD family protein [Anaerolineales bacterium]|nr:RibD family protein [Anaerolineales bacterium]
MQLLEDIENWPEQARDFRRAHGRPLVRLSYAQSLDGCLAARRGQPTALSGPEASRLTHRLRAAHDAILVGVGTVLADDPLLTVRLVSGENPQPVILDSRLRTPPGAKLIRPHPRPAWIATTAAADARRRAALQVAGVRLLEIAAETNGRVRLSALLERLASLGINSLMVEGGASVITSFLEARLADQFVITVAALFLGGLRAVEASEALSGDALRLQNTAYERLGDDLIIWGNFPYIPTKP